MKQVNVKKLVLPNLPYAAIGLYASKLEQAWRLAEGADNSQKLLHLLDGISAAFQNSFPSFRSFDLLAGLVCGVLLRLAVYYKAKNTKKYRQGAEYGTARWGTAADIAPYIAPAFEDNIILTQTERLEQSLLFGNLPTTLCGIDKAISIVIQAVQVTDLLQLPLAEFRKFSIKAAACPFSIHMIF